MFAREKKEEYDPTHIPIIERPLAKQVQGNAFDGKGISGLRNEERIKFGHNRSKSEITVTAPFSPNRSPLKENANTLVNNKFNGSVTSLSGSPSKDAGSPTKSALASTPKFGSKASYDPEHGNWDEDVSEIELPPGSRSMHRPAKSVTFNAAPPEINEYEMVTPDLSSIGGDSRENSYDSEEDEDDSYHSQQREREDSFDDSLEDTSKTPVVGPDDWRRTSLDSDYRYDDAQDHSSPMQSGSTSPQLTRVLSGDSRPLPPLPGLSGSPEREDIRTTLFGAADRASQSPSLRPTSSAGLGGSLFGGSLTKSDIQNMTGGRMPLEERLRLMMIQDAPKSAAETQRERRMRRSGNKERHSVNSEAEDSEIKIHEDEDTLAELGDYELPSHRISRESILRKVQDRTAEAGERTGSNNYYSSPMPEASSDRPSALNLDPDVPLPSVEKDNDFMDEDSIVFKPDDEDSVLDMYNNIPLAPRPKERPESRLSDNRISGAKIRQSLQDDDDISMYSELSESTPQNIGIGKDDSGPPTPKAMPKLEPSAPLPTSPLANDQNDAKAGGLDFSGFMSTNDFARSLESFRTPSPPPAPPPKDEQKVERTSSTEVKPTEQSVQPKAADIPRMKTPPPLQKVTTWGSKNDYDGAGWGSDPDEYVEEPGTPESVIRHEVKYEYSPSPSPEPEDDTPEMESPGLPVVPEKHATIKSAAGSKLKTRPSATPADIKAMMDMRRQVSHDYPIPPIPQRHLNRPSLDAKSDEQNEEPEHRSDGEVEVGQRKVSLKKKSLTLDIGIGDDLDLGLGLDKEFDDIIEQEKVAFYQSLNNPSAKHYSSTDPFRGPAAQTKTDSSNQADWIHKDFTNVTSRTQRGYLMRQNTKVVVASSDIDQPKDVRNARSAGNSPVKQQRPQSWTVEPWNGSRRKPSGRQSIGGRNKPGMGAVPPLPGMKSNVDGGLGAVAEDDIAEPEGENTERGRLFVKVIGVKDLDLPLPRNERTWFALTLDNGVHCVTTAWLELGRNAPIGQEFELVVPNELEFQLTLNAKLTRPPPKRIETGPVKPTKAAKPSTFSRVFASPKKRKEMEMKAKLEEQQLAARKQEEALAKHNSQDPTAWELLSPLSGEDGSFGRSYVCLKDHESRCYGRPYIVDVACFNEWAMEDIQGMSSVKSKTGSVVQRKRAPYKVGKLELQLLFVPKPKGAKEDDMPKSMNSCIRAMKEAEAAQERVFEGFLSQQGGDCPVSYPITNYGSITNKNSTGAAASSSSRALNSPPTTSPPANHAQPSTSPTHPSSSMTAAP